MATTTSNYNLIKPALTDVADITAFNSNWDTIDTNLKKASESGGTPTVTATSTNGVAYTATVSNITELTNGLTITIIPNMASESTSITLNVNGLGAKSIVIPLSTNTGTSVAPKDTTFIVANRPLTLQYDSGYSTYGGWRTLGKQKTSAGDLYGTVPIESGGTGATNAADARTNLDITPENIGAAPASHSHTISDVNNLQTTLNGKATTARYTATIPASGWSASNTVTVAVSGMLASDTPIVDIVQTGTSSTDETMRENWAKITRITTAANSITVYASEVPSASIPIQLKVVR